jgi:putative flippase GtrA
LETIEADGNRSVVAEVPQMRGSMALPQKTAAVNLHRWYGAHEWRARARSRRNERSAVAVSGLRKLLSPASGLPGQGTRYALAGSVVAVVYLCTTTFLAVVVGMSFREALPIGFTLQLVVHYTLQRKFVWVHDKEFALSFRHQAPRYLAVAGMQLGVTAVAIALLPAVLGLPAEVVYLGTVVLMTSVNFLLFRYVVFHPERSTLSIRI